MHGSSQKQAYDRGITIFSPDGRLYQVEYAREAVERGTPAVGVRTSDGVVLAADKHLRSPLLEPESVEKLHAIDDHLGVASAGHAADARQLIDLARRTAQGNRLRYDEPIGVDPLTTDLSDHIQEYTQNGGARPFGVAMLVAGVEAGRPRLFETDPSGTPYEWQATAIGAGYAEIRSFLESAYRSDLDLEGAIDVSLRGLAEVSSDAFAPDGVDVAIIDAETERFKPLGQSDKRERLAALDLLSNDFAS